MNHDFKLLTKRDIEIVVNQFPERIDTIKTVTLEIPINGNYETAKKHFLKKIRKDRMIIYAFKSNDDLLEAIIGDDLQEAGGESKAGDSIF